MERAVPEPARRYESYAHETMAAEVEAGNDPAAASEISEQWAGLGTRLRESMEALSSISQRSQEAWEGAGGEAVRATLAKAAKWSGQATEVSFAVADAVTNQAGIAARARAEMPPPVHYDPAQMIREAAQGGLLSLVGLSETMSDRRAQAEAARMKAIDVMNARDAALRSAVPPRSFDAPPELGQP
jgi:hypothetical protein